MNDMVKSRSAKRCKPSRLVGVFVITLAASGLALASSAPPTGVTVA